MRTRPRSGPSSRSRSGISCGSSWPRRPGRGGGGVLIDVGGALGLLWVKQREAAAAPGGTAAAELPGPSRSNLREVPALRPYALGGDPEGGELVVVQIELDDPLHAVPRQPRRDPDVDALDPVLAGRPRAHGQHVIRAGGIASTILATEADGA